MIYICYIFCKGGVEICMLTVRDSEQDSSTYKVMSPDVATVAEGGTVWEGRGIWGNHTDKR